MKFLEAFNDILWGPPLIALIVLVGLIGTLGSRVFQVRFFGHIMSETFGKLFKGNKKGDGDGMLTPFQAISMAVGGAVGTGNIGGVATAISVGGPGALFWMWIASFLGMISKMMEVSLAVHYREEDKAGGFYGGPTFYIQNGLGKEMGFKLWLIPALMFGIGLGSTVFLTMTTYNVSDAIASTLNLNQLPVAIFYTCTTFVCIVGGMKGVAKVAAKLVPFMCLFYILSGLIIILLNIPQIPAAFAMIFKSAFTGQAAVGGFAGATVRSILTVGFKRALYSNEAGWGTSPMIHASSQTPHPIRQGLWGAFEVFVDTLVVCSITGLVIIVTGVWNSGETGAALTLSAFETYLGMPGRIVIAASVYLFAFTTTGGWWSYHEVLFRHLLGDREELKRKVLNVFKFIYPTPGLFITWLAVRGNMPGDEVWIFSDIGSGVPTFVNLIVLIFLSKKFFELLKDYKARYLGIGEIDPDFCVFYQDKVRKEEKKASNQ